MVNDMYRNARNLRILQFQKQACKSLTTASLSAANELKLDPKTDKVADSTNGLYKSF